MTAIALLIMAAIPIHLIWLRKQRLSLLPPIGSRWLYGAYLSFYRVEVIDHHPFSGEVTITRVKVDDPLGIRTNLRVNAKIFLSAAKPLKER